MVDAIKPGPVVADPNEDDVVRWCRTWWPKSLALWWFSKSDWWVCWTDVWWLSECDDAAAAFLFILLSASFNMNYLLSRKKTFRIEQNYRFCVGWANTLTSASWQDCISKLCIVRYVWDVRIHRTCVCGRHSNSSQLTLARIRLLILPANRMCNWFAISDSNIHVRLITTLHCRATEPFRTFSRFDFTAFMHRCLRRSTRLAQAPSFRFW